MKKILYTLGLFGLLTFGACSDTDPVVDEEPEFNNNIKEEPLKDLPTGGYYGKPCYVGEL